MCDHLQGLQVGIVESITLKNFMCHSLLGPITFGSNVNFVVGNNGSELIMFILFISLTCFYLPQYVLLHLCFLSVLRVIMSQVERVLF